MYSPLLGAVVAYTASRLLRAKQMSSDQPLRDIIEVADCDSRDVGDLECRRVRSAAFVPAVKFEDWWLRNEHALPARTNLG